MAKRELGEPSGKCPICTINLWGDEVLNLPKGKEIKDEKGKSYNKIVGKPVVFPCGIYRPNQGRCPWETKEQQDDLNIVKDYEKIAGVLGTMHTND